MNQTYMLLALTFTSITTSSVLPLYIIFLICNKRYKLNTCSLVEQFSLLAISIIPSIHLFAENAIRMTFIISILHKPFKSKLSDLFSKLTIPYFLLNCNFKVIKLGHDSSTLAFYHPDKDIRELFSNLAIKNSGSLLTLLGQREWSNSHRSGQVKCIYRNVIDENAEDNKYIVNYFKLGKGKLFVSFYCFKKKVKNHKRSIKDQSNYILSFSHEIRNPLNGIVGILSQLKKKATKNIKQLVTTGLSSACLLRYKIDSFIDFVHITTNQLTLKLVEINIENLLHKLSKLFASHLKDGIVFLIKKDNLLPSSFLQDEERLLQILTKLISNAFKYTLKGSISLDITFVDWNQIKFIITDTGCGMTQVEIEKVKMSWAIVKNNQANYKSSELSGLGLQTIQLLLEKMQSQLFIQSKLGEGTQISFKFMIEESSSPTFSNYRKQLRRSISVCDKPPIKLYTEMAIPEEIDESLGIMHPSTKFDRTPGNSKKVSTSRRKPSICKTINVMVVDDCTVNRMVHKMLLKKYTNFNITEHCNGQEAVDYIKVLSKNTQCIIILMDINMPVMNGIEASREIRALSLSAPVYIIAVSAFSDEKEISLVYECGMNFHITKPVTKESLSLVLSLIC